MAMRLAPVGERAANLPESGVRVFEDLVRDHAREIQLFLRKLCGNHHDAEELAQDVFIKAYRKGTAVGEQNQNIQAKIEPGAAAGMTRVTAIAGRSLGIAGDKRSMVTRLHNYLRSLYGNR